MQFGLSFVSSERWFRLRVDVTVCAGITSALTVTALAGDGAGSQVRRRPVIGAGKELPVASAIRRRRCLLSGRSTRPRAQAGEVSAGSQRGRHSRRCSPDQRW